jgi:pimeloyl-ACP methyl ester carboxylesterase
VADAGVSWQSPGSVETSSYWFLVIFRPADIIEHQSISRRRPLIPVRVLIADGTIDQLDPVANDYALARLIEGARLKLYPDAGHAFMFQDEKAFVPLIESFLH